MAEEEKQTLADSSPSPPTKFSPHSDPPPLPQFDPSRMIGIIKRKALIKELAAAYHAECLAHCRELLELQKKKDEPFLETKFPEDSRKEISRPSKRAKKTR
ncbi:PREDICTED: uncharacterized protein LOC104798400 [Tarenaya hassleriana]|uniref:uncharacterized protein LOC104798400 n=1 Tax=Tarenaya hassleriana TaxID=28532 RepID=UPI00053C2FEE|nr:PREDICTED: uncharacterized protein LOC104798400 [Tarenaya hassleriana]